MKKNIILSLLTVLLMTVSGTVSAQPDESLARHNFFYAGQSKRLRMFIVKDGQVSWAHEYKGRGEISDAVLLTDGHILIAHQYGIAELDKDGNAIWW